MLDTETTGLSRKKGSVCGNHRIIEIGCIEIVDGVLGKTWHSYINPGRKNSKKATEIHGIPDSMLQSKPPFCSILESLLAFIGSSPVVMHNAPFDICFLDKEFSLVDKSQQPRCRFRYIDTLPFFRCLYPETPNSLDHLRQKFYIPPPKHHSALSDATDLAIVLLSLWF